MIEFALERTFNSEFNLKKWTLLKYNTNCIIFIEGLEVKTIRVTLEKRDVFTYFLTLQLSCYGTAFLNERLG